MTVRLNRTLPLLLLSPVLALALSSPAWADTSGAGTVSTTTVTVGTPVLFSGTGFAPGTTVVCTRDGVQVGTPTADATGRFEWTMKSPTAGQMTYQATGRDATNGTRTLTASVTVGVAAAAPSVNSGSGGKAATTGGDGVLAVLLVGGSAVLVAAGARGRAPQ